MDLCWRDDLSGPGLHPAGFDQEEFLMKNMYREEDREQIRGYQRACVVFIIIRTQSAKASVLKALAYRDTISP